MRRPGSFGHLIGQHVNAQNEAISVERNPTHGPVLVVWDDNYLHAAPMKLDKGTREFLRRMLEECDA